MQLPPSVVPSIMAHTPSTPNPKPCLLPGLVTVPAQTCAVSSTVVDETATVDETVVHTRVDQIYSTVDNSQVNQSTGNPHQLMSGLGASHVHSHAIGQNYGHPVS